ncbi:MAG: hypothetical protein AAFO77_07460, partial [Pseudomonadota bacterium]
DWYLECDCIALLHVGFEELKRRGLQLGNAITFQIPIGLLADDQTKLVSKAISHRDVRDGFLYIGQRRGRPLSVAAARFADQLMKELSGIYQTV